MELFELLISCCFGILGDVDVCDDASIQADVLLDLMNTSQPVLPSVCYAASFGLIGAAGVRRTESCCSRDQK
jgi:hypothetical protein